MTEKPPGLMEPAKTDLDQDVTNRRAEAVFLVAAAVLALAVRAWALWARGVVDFDETYYYILGKNLVTGAGYRLNGLSHTAFPPLYPMLVGAASFLTGSIRVATSSVSAAAGALVVFPVYFLARDVYGRRAARFSALAAAVWPALFFFAAVGVPSAEKLYGGSEPLYTTLVASGGAALWLFARRGGLWRAALAGLFLGLASLVRNEAPMLVAFLLAWLVIERALARALFTRRTLAGIACAVLCMLAAYGPFLVYLHSATGRWGLGAKLSNNVRIRDAMWEWVAKGRPLEFLAIHYQLSEDATAMEDPYWGVDEARPERGAEKGSLADGLRLVASPQPRWLRMWWSFLLRRKTAILPLWILAVVIIGALPSMRSKAQLKWWALVASVLASTAFVAVSLFVTARHIVFLAPFLAVGLGKGLEVAGDVVAQMTVAVFPGASRTAVVLSYLPAAGVLAAMLVCGVYLNADANQLRSVRTGLENQTVDRFVAERLERTLPPGSPLMCLEPWVAVWAGMEWRVPPLAPAYQVVGYAEKRGIDYTLIGPTWLDASSGPEGIRGLCANGPGLLRLGPYYLRTFVRGDAPADGEGAAGRLDTPAQEP